MNSKNFIIVLLLLLPSAPGISQKLVADLMKLEMEQMLVNDRLLLDSATKMQPANDLWDKPGRNNKTRDAVIKQFDDFHNKIAFKMQPPACAKESLYGAVISGSSLYNLGGRVLPGGSLPPYLSGTKPEFLVPGFPTLGIPSQSFENDNASFGFTSYSLFDVDASGKLELNMGDKVNTRINAYISDSANNAYQMNYVCGLFENYLAELADSINTLEKFSLYSWPVVRSFYERSHLQRQGDALIRSFKGVLLFSKKGAYSFKQIGADVMVKAGIAAGIIRVGSQLDLQRDKSLGFEASSMSYKIYPMTPFATVPLPGAAAIQRAVRNTISVDVAPGEYTLKNDKSAEASTVRILVPIGPLDSIAYEKLAVDKRYFDSRLSPRGIISVPEIIPQPYDKTSNGMQSIELKISLNDAYSLDPTSSTARGLAFSVPLRLYYDDLNSRRDTLVFFESADPIKIRYTNYPIVGPMHKFDFTGRDNNGNYKFAINIPVELEDGDELMDASNMIVRLADTLSGDTRRLLNITNIITDRMGAAKGDANNDTNPPFYKLDCTINKEIMDAQSGDLELPFILRIRTKYQDKSNLYRITKLIIPKPPSTPAPAAVNN